MYFFDLFAKKKSEKGGPEPQVNNVFYESCISKKKKKKTKKKLNTNL